MTNAELAILSLVVEQRRHGYEIEQVIEQRGMREWTDVGFSSIYYILKKLESAGLVDGRLEQQAGRGPARKVYAVTEDGRAAWHAATVEVLSTPQRPNMPLQLGLANLPGLTKSERVTAVRQYRDRLAQQRDHVRARYQQEGQAPPHHVKAMFDHSLTLMEAQLAWIEGFIDELSADKVPGT
jgi:DNA-binding PadR family transcriptional regulator